MILTRASAFPRKKTSRESLSDFPAYGMELLICIKSDAYDDSSMENITLIINGETRTISPVASMRELLQLLGISEDRVAIELNRKIIRRSDWDKTAISNQDRVEIVQFVGGG